MNSVQVPGSIDTASHLCQIQIVTLKNPVCILHVPSWIKRLEVTHVKAMHLRMADKGGTPHS